MYAWHYLHHVRRHAIDLRVHVDLLVTDINQQHAEVGAAQIQCDERSLLVSIGKMSDKRWQHFY